MTDEITLDAIELGAQAIVSDAVRNLVSFETEIEPKMRAMLTHAFITLAGQRFAPVEFSAPADWWQAVKDRWAPRWALRRWPVRMRSVKWTPEIVYPMIALPKEARWENPYRG